MIKLRLVNSPDTYDESMVNYEEDQKNPLRGLM